MRTARRETSALNVTDSGWRFDLLETLFVLSAFIAPLNLLVFQALTAYDLVIFGLAFLIIAGPRRIRPLPPWLILGAGVFLVAALASSFRAIYPAEALTQVLQFGFIFFVQLPVVLTLVRSTAVLHAALLAFTAGSLIVLLVALLTGEAGGAHRIVSYSTDNPNVLGYPAAYLTPFVLYYLSDLWRKGHPILSITAAGSVIYLFLWTLTASASRSATLATLVGAILFLTFRGGDGRRLRIAARFSIAVLTITLLGAILFQTEYFPPTLRERLLGTFSTETDAVEDERLALDRAGLQAFAGSPLVGLGLNNFRHVGQFYDDEANVHDPHNLWVQFLAQIGLVGTAAFLVIIGGWFRLLHRAKSFTRARAPSEFLWAFIASMAAILVFHLATPIMIQRHYWLLVGLGVAAAWRSTADIQMVPADGYSPASLRRHRGP